MADQDYVAQLEQYAQQLEHKNTELQQAYSSSSFSAQQSNNPVEYQLNVKDIHEDIERQLRGQRLKRDQYGNETWKDPGKKEQDLIALNEYGISLIMETVLKYVNKNTMLSFYDEMRINEILGDLGDELADVVFCNYEKMGMNTKAKQSRYLLIVLGILHMVESAYRRALKGKEREEINASRIFTQSDGGRLGSGLSMSSPVRKKFSLLKPSTW